MVAKCHYGLIIGIQGVLVEVFGSQVIAEVGSCKDANVSSVLIYGHWNWKPHFAEFTQERPHFADSNSENS